MQVDTAFRNATYDPIGTITCEILHPIFGWISFTASPVDPEPHGRALFFHISTVGPVSPPVVLEEVLQEIPTISEEP